MPGMPFNKYSVISCYPSVFDRIIRDSFVFNSYENTVRFTYMDDDDNSIELFINRLITNTLLSPEEYYIDMNKGTDTMNKRNDNNAVVVDKIVSSHPRYVFIHTLNGDNVDDSKHRLVLFNSKKDAETWINDDIKYEVSMATINHNANYDYSVTHDNGETYPTLAIGSSNDYTPKIINYRLMKAPVKNTWKHTSCLHN